MLELFFLGSKLLMGILTVVVTAMIIQSVVSIRTIMANQVNEKTPQKIRLVREIGLFAFMVGILASAIDLMGAFSAIEMAGDVSPSLLAAGLKFTLIAPVYGLMIYVLSLIIWFALNWKVNKMIA
uniref:MotA/TolQ/ExbB proton channel family protein n=1 Tax=Roseivirga sp. TaxID=1964215 RepID=UPI0040485214